MSTCAGRKSTSISSEPRTVRQMEYSQKAAALGLTNRQIRRVRSCLRRWGHRNYQSYPWRSDTDGWLTLVAEVLLQRTQARQVEKVYMEFRKYYPTPLLFLEANTHELTTLIGALGFAFRIPILQELARIAVNRNGALPETIAELTRVKGVGMYTVSAWLSLHRGKRAVLVDSNIARWLSRMTGNPYNRDPRHVSWVQELAENLTPPRAFRNYNYAVLDFAMQMCTPRKPSCGCCPIRTECLYGSNRVDKDFRLGDARAPAGT